MAKRKNAGLFSARKTKKARKAGYRAGEDRAVSRLQQQITAAAKKAKRSGRRSSNPKTVYDAAGNEFAKARSKAAKIIARVIGGTVGKPKKNPLPVGRYVTVRAKRLPNGKVQLFGAGR